jgi:hypothetical protein
MAEYIVIAVLVAIIVIVAIRKYGGSISEQVGGAADDIANVRNDKGGFFPRDSAGSGDSETTGGGALDDSSSPIARESSAGTGRKLNSGGRSIEDLKPAGVGGEDYQPIEQIRLDWKLLGFMFGLFAAAAFAVVFAKRRKKGKGKGAKKKLFQRKESGKKSEGSR